MSLQAFVSSRVVTPQEIRPGAVLVEGERILDLVSASQVPADASVFEFGDSAILPGLVDSHVHINDPGRADWEGFETATRAAAAGGYTTVVDMPLNCLPATSTVEALEAKREAARGRCWVDWAAWGGLVADNRMELEALAGVGVPGFKCFLVHPGIEGFTMVTEAELRGALPQLARTGLPLLVHAELPGPLEAACAELADEDWRDYSVYLQSRPEEAELSAIDLLLSLCREYKFRLHIVHLSAASALPALRAGRREGLALTVETCPHYLHLCAEEIGRGATLCKCAPPIRSRENRDQLWQGLRDGIIDLVATDHSPCPPAMKQLEQGSFKTAWGGIAGLSMALPVVWTEARARGFTLADLARWMAESTARLAGCEARKGRIAAGCDADLVVFRPEAEFTVTADRLFHRYPVSPYLGERLCGLVQATYLRGQIVYGDGQFLGGCRGVEIC